MPIPPAPPPQSAPSLVTRLQRRIRNKATSFYKARRTTLWQKRVAATGHTVYQIAPAVKMKLHSDSLLSRLIFLNEFENNERNFLLRFLRSGDVFVDVGANVGFFTLIAAQLAGPTGRVLAFEPVSKTCERLRENITLNGFKNIQIEQCGLSNTEGNFTMMVAEDEMDAFNSFAPPHKGHHYAQQTVFTTTWDQFVSRNSSLSGRVTFMKIDVEGWEANVLEGSRVQLSRPDAPILQVEFTDDAAKAAGCSCRENYQLLESLGYELYIYDPISKTLRADPIRQEYPYLNLYAIKDFVAVQSRLHG